MPAVRAGANAGQNRRGMSRGGEVVLDGGSPPGLALGERFAYSKG